MCSHKVSNFYYRPIPLLRHLLNMICVSPHGTFCTIVFVLYPLDCYTRFLSMLVLPNLCFALTIQNCIELIIVADCFSLFMHKELIFYHNRTRLLQGKHNHMDDADKV